MRFALRRGFTLVELLVVIALIAVIALIVIAAINPIEQANRARDTRFGADASQLISAIERYYAARNSFPWVGATGGPTSNDAALDFTSAASSLIGICGTSCSTSGPLISTEELRAEFRQRDFIQDTSSDPSKKIRVGKASGSSASVYACYIPLSNASKQKACAENDVFTLDATGGTRTAVPSTTCSSSTGDWSTSGWYVCLPS